MTKVKEVLLKVEGGNVVVAGWDDELISARSCLRFADGDGDGRVTEQGASAGTEAHEAHACVGVVG
jgi:hypothetical protein